MTIRVIPYKIGGIKEIQEIWRDWVLSRNFEGLVITEQKGPLYRIVKVKTWQNIDAVILAIDTTGKMWPRGMFGSLYLGLMDKKGRIIEIGKMSGGTDEWKAKMRKKLEKDKVKQIGGKLYVKPRYVVEVTYLETAPGREYWNAFKVSSDGRLKPIPLPPEYRKLKPFSIRAGLKFVRDRPDKGVNSKDIRLEQIPEFYGTTGREYLLSKFKAVENRGRPMWKRVSGLKDLEQL